MTRWADDGRDARRMRFSVDELVANYREAGAEQQAAYEAEAAADLAAAAMRTRCEAWHRMCPAKFQGAELGWTREEHGDDVHRVLTRWRDDPNHRNLVLLGPVGTGKTGSGLALLRPGWIEHGREVAFWPVVDLLRGLRPDGGVDLDRLMRVDVLFLDDLGAERPTEWTAEQLYALVNRRWLEERPTVVSSNLEPGALAEAVGERMFSRLVGDGATVVRLAGKDRRRG